jgi:hypothetical protein
LKSSGETINQQAVAIIILLGSVLLCLIGPVVGGGLGYVAYDALTTSSAKHWQALGRPPEAAVRVLDANHSAVYVQAASGAVYGYELTAPQPAWQPIDWPVEIDHYPEASPYQGQIPPDPGVVIDRRAVAASMSEAAFWAEYVVVEDGTVWAWRYGIATPVIFLGLLMAGGGMAIGAVCGLVGLIMGLIFAMARWRGE